MDYVERSGSIQLTSDDRTTFHGVLILPDEIAEGVETLGLMLSNPSIRFSGEPQADEVARLQIAPDTATVVILDANGKTTRLLYYHTRVYVLQFSIFLFQVCF